jgi:Zn-dependent protease
MNREFYLPYLLNYSQPVAEDMIIICLAMLIAILVSAEGQGFVATLLGDSHPGQKDRLHFNVFLHMSVLGTLCFLVAGFGWAKEVRVDTSNFKGNRRLSLIVTRMAGPVANLLMANIAASLSWLLIRWGFDDQVFSSIVVVNVTMAIYGLIMVPPLPGFSLLEALLPMNKAGYRIKDMLRRFGPFLIIGSFFPYKADRLGGGQFDD